LSLSQGCGRSAAPTIRGRTSGCLSQAVVRELGYLKAGAFDALERSPVAVATVPEPDLKAVETILPAREPRLVRAHVTEEQQLPAWLEQPVDLVESTAGIINGAENFQTTHARHLTHQRHHR